MLEHKYNFFFHKTGTIQLKYKSLVSGTINLYTTNISEALVYKITRLNQ